jgi:hypothetical protein
MHYFWPLTLSSTIFFNIFRCSLSLHSLNLKLCSKQLNKNFVLYLMLAPQLSSGWQHNYSTKTRQMGCANEQSIILCLCIPKITIKSYIKNAKPESDHDSLKSYCIYYGKNTLWLSWRTLLFKCR